jgi:peptide/nickel transport system permease protein
MPSDPIEGYISQMQNQAGQIHNNRIATALEVFGVVLYPIPYYILALMLILLPAYTWKIFLLSTIIRSGASLGTILYNSALPALTLITAGFGWNILSMKSLAFATKEEPYVTLWRAFLAPAPFRSSPVKSFPTSTPT